MKNSALRQSQEIFYVCRHSVWYEGEDIQWDLRRHTMGPETIDGGWYYQLGIIKSKFVLPCISRDYEKSKNCMFELAETYRLANFKIYIL